ncbi:SPFH domain / Band 7 family protein [Janthinobacterium agaricidamnosum NBRC 102515 = DSM 9628]|uniref:SPFH domain / Band 7 family protein n=2 Tax=Janthinobacterium agaricidamnosum TaxID=55508 RepID=W0UWN8_9BURK|nr:SPFH domain / Band 7 family protein [Janthinobacterium agaricidamnosum NBRC 102515 = DSM 9628]
MKLDKAEVLAPAATGWRAKIHRWFEANVVELTVAALVALAILIVLSPHVVYTVPAGHVGVLWKRFHDGTVTERTYGEGTHLIFPWDDVALYDTRTRLGEMTVDCLMADGLSVGVKVAYRYRLVANNVGHLHRRLGPHFLESLLVPDIAAQTRSVLGKVRAEEIYSNQRSTLEAAIREIVERNVKRASNTLSATPELDILHVENVLISSIVLPPTVRAAIEQKNEQKQRIEEYAFRVKVEQLERERKQIEAEGVRNFQQVVSGSITNGYLRLRGIDATTQLAQSPNAKVVVVGGGQSGMPLILGGMDSAPSNTPMDKVVAPAGPVSSPAADAKPKAAATADPLAARK